MLVFDHRPCEHNAFFIGHLKQCSGGAMKLLQRQQKTKKTGLKEIMNEFVN